jgi:hypothetical protein
VKNILKILLFVLFIPVDFFSQSSIDISNRPIKFPHYELAKTGVKSCNVYLLCNNIDSVLTEKKIYNIEGKILQHITFNIKTQDTIINNRFYYKNDKLIEIKERFKGSIYSYNNDKIKTIKKWNHKNDTTFFTYSYVDFQIEPSSVEIIDNNRVLTHMFFNYNSKNLYESSSDQKGIIHTYYEYNSDGNLILELNADKSINKSYKYNNDKKIVEFVVHNDPYQPHKKIVYKYDESGNIIEESYFMDGKLQNVTIFNIKNDVKYKQIYFKKIKRRPDETYIIKYSYW